MICRGSHSPPDNGPDGPDVITSERFIQLTTQRIRSGWCIYWRGIVSGDYQTNKKTNIQIPTLKWRYYPHVIVKTVAMWDRLRYDSSVMASDRYWRLGRTRPLPREGTESRYISFYSLVKSLLYLLIILLGSYLVLILGFCHQFHRKEDLFYIKIIQLFREEIE